MAERTVTLVGSEGQREVLACPGGPYFLGTNSALWGTAPLLVDSRPLGGLDGEVVESIRIAPRDLVVPVRIIEGTDSEIDNRLDVLGQMIRQGAQCHIEVDTAGTRNTRRTITARCTGGLDAVPIDRFDDGGVVTVRLQLQFRAFDPYWRDVEDPISSYGPEEFDNAFAAKQNKITIDSLSTVPVWPTWRFTGVTENINVLNLRTMKYFRYIREITGIGDVVEIRTDPRAETGAFYNNQGRDWGFDANSELWPLLPGDNTILVSGLNPTGDSPIGGFELDWVRRFDEP